MHWHISSQMPRPSLPLPTQAPAEAWSERAATVLPHQVSSPPPMHHQDTITTGTRIRLLDWNLAPCLCARSCHGPNQPGRLCRWQCATMAMEQTLRCRQNSFPKSRERPQEPGWRDEEEKKLSINKPCWRQPNHPRRYHVQLSQETTIAREEAGLTRWTLAQYGSLACSRPRSR